MNHQLLNYINNNSNNKWYRINYLIREDRIFLQLNNNNNNINNSLKFINL